MCGSGGGAGALPDRRARQPAHDSPYDSDPPASFRGGHQHDPGIASACVAGDHHLYAEVDLEMKAKALAGGEVKDPEPRKPWRENEGLMAFLRNL
jgi:hypothetical protein